MSLLDALLLGPVRIDVWVANRAGQNIAGSEPSSPAFTFQTLWQEKRLARENNVIDLESAYPITWGGTGTMRLFHNQASNGRLLDGYSEAAARWWGDAAKDVEDAFILALI
jgi:hypothetical protein